MKFLAMDRPRVLWVCLGLFCCAGAPGCAQWQAFRHPDQHMLGSVNTDNPYDGAGALANRSTRQEFSPSRSRLARSEDEQTGPETWADNRLARTPGALDRNRRDPDRPIEVALEPPRPVAPRGLDRGMSGALAPKAPLSSSSGPRTQQEETHTPVDDSIRRMSFIVNSSRARLESTASYQVLLTRMERVGEKLQPAEDVVLSIRRQPFAVRIEWTEGPHKGREVLYASDRDGGVMHINMADSVVPVPRVSMPPNSPLALSNSRHPITEAGFETILASLETALELQQTHHPAAGQLTYQSLERTRELEHPCHKFEQVKPNGDTWSVYIDSETQLPALVEASNSQGDLLERYLFRNLRTDVPELASATAFDPNTRWGQPQGFLQRMARAGSLESKGTESPPR